MSSWFSSASALPFPAEPVVRVADPATSSVSTSTPLLINSLAASPDDFKWRLNVPSATEAFTFYLTLSNGTYVLAQMVYSAVGLSPSVQMTLRMYNSDKTKYASTLSPSMSNFKVSDDKLSVTCDQMQFTYNPATRGYTLVFDLGVNVAAVNVLLTPTDAPFKVNDGRLPFGAKDSDGFVDAAFYPRHEATGTISFEGKTTNVVGWGSSSHVIQYKPQVPAKWNFVNLQNEKDAIMLYEFDLPKGGKCTSIGTVVRNGRTIAVTTTNRSVHVQKQNDSKFSGYDVPTQLFVVLNGKTQDLGEDVHVEISIVQKNLLDAIDVLAQLPYLLKVFIQTFITAPYVYQWYEDVSAKVTIGKDSFTVDGKAFIECAFLLKE
ncbi:putative cell survival pathways protein [Physocladia obscura]|uniref:Cell survival pathways protein n=1 Tax=Physocladia obscura TaxID=109957 RepID=A0AAD5XCU9_9FUNG|nr:putative cell survival pathways protein [Physocladia obscura]